MILDMHIIGLFHIVFHCYFTVARMRNTIPFDNVYRASICMYIFKTQHSIGHKHIECIQRLATTKIKRRKIRSNENEKMTTVKIIEQKSLSVQLMCSRLCERLRSTQFSVSLYFDKILTFIIG